MIRKASFRSWRLPDGRVNPAEPVVREEQRKRRFVLLPLLLWAFAGLLKARQQTQKRRACAYPQPVEDSMVCVTMVRAVFGPTLAITAIRCQGQSHTKRK